MLMLSGRVAVVEVERACEAVCIKWRGKQSDSNYSCTVLLPSLLGRNTSQIHRSQQQPQHYNNITLLCYLDSSDALFITVISVSSRIYTVVCTMQICTYIADLL